MSLETDAFRQLDPPPGGAERLRRRLRERRASPPVPTRRLAYVAIGAIVLAAGLAVMLESRSPSEQRIASVSDAPELDRLLGRPIERTGLAVSMNGEASSVSELPSSHSRIRIYEID